MGRPSELTDNPGTLYAALFPIVNIRFYEYSLFCMNAQLQALAHPARLSILKAVSKREHTVGELSTRLRLRQPTTSQHLQVLRDAKLVSVRSVANRRLYVADPDQIQKLRALLDGFWHDSLEALKGAAESPTRVRRKK